KRRGGFCRPVFLVEMGDDEHHCVVEHKVFFCDSKSAACGGSASAEQIRSVMPPQAAYPAYRGANAKRHGGGCAAGVSRVSLCDCVF
ncbi:MAG: hypothetical protein IJT18_07830, partial [Oscillospiraceae bacterium]|nr:hypothetical protein [Oscillospiraceae bacterium]